MPRQKGHEHRIADQLGDIFNAAYLPSQFSPTCVPVQEFPDVPILVYIVDHMPGQDDPSAALMHALAYQVIFSETSLTPAKPPIASRSDFLISIDLPTTHGILEKPVKEAYASMTKEFRCRFSKTARLTPRLCPV